MLLLRVYLKFTKNTGEVFFPSLVSQDLLGTRRVPRRKVLLEEFLINCPASRKANRKGLEGKRLIQNAKIACTRPPVL